MNIHSFFPSQIFTHLVNTFIQKLHAEHLNVGKQINIRLIDEYEFIANLIEYLQTYSC